MSKEELKGLLEDSLKIRLEDCGVDTYSGCRKIEVSVQFDGETICEDSMEIYVG